MNVDDLLSEINDFLNDPGCVVPELALDLIVRSRQAVIQLVERVSVERARGNLLQEKVDLAQEQALALNYRESRRRRIDAALDGDL